MNVDVTVPRVATKLNAVCGKVSPNSAVLEGIHAEGPIVATLGGLPQSEAQMSTADFEALLEMLGPERVSFFPQIFRMPTANTEGPRRTRG